MTGSRLLRLVAAAGRHRVRGFRRELSRPWREGRSGRAAETGRWVGVGLAVGAFVAGVAAAIRVERRR